MSTTTFVPSEFAHLLRELKKELEAAGITFEMDIPEPTPEPAPATYAKVEIMGHRTHVGEIREVVKFGATMLQIDTLELPAIEASKTLASRTEYGETLQGFDVIDARDLVPSRRYYFPPAAIFSIQEMSFDEAFSYASGSRGQKYFVYDSSSRHTNSESLTRDPFSDDQEEN